MRLRNIAVLLFGALLLGCSKTIYVPIHDVEKVEVHDTTVLHRTDTLVQIPQFNLSDYVGLRDTLRLTASNSEAAAWVDEGLLTLRGRLVQTGKVPVQIVERERVVYKDSIRDREVPVPVEVEKRVRYTPWFVKVLAWIGGIGLLALAVWLLRKFGVL